MLLLSPLISEILVSDLQLGILTVLIHYLYTDVALEMPNVMSNYISVPQQFFTPVGVASVSYVVSDIFSYLHFLKAFQSL
jgi:hypothetical protein